MDGQVGCRRPCDGCLVSPCPQRTRGGEGPGVQPGDEPGGIQDLNIAIQGTPNPGQAPVNVDFSATIEVPDRIEETDVLGYDRIVEDSDGSIRIVEV